MKVRASKKNQDTPRIPKRNEREKISLLLVLFPSHGNALQSVHSKTDFFRSFFKLTIFMQEKEIILKNEIRF